MLAEFSELREYRNVHNWTWDELAADMAKADAPVSPRTLAYLCHERHGDVRPYERTLYKIRKYLAKIRRADKRAAVRRKVSA